MTPAFAVRLQGSAQEGMTPDVPYSQIMPTLAAIATVQHHLPKVSTCQAMPGTLAKNDERSPKVDED